MQANPVDLIGGFYADDALPWSAQDTVNWLPTLAEMAGTRTPNKLRTPPGLRAWTDMGTTAIRGLHNCGGALFAVCGQTLYQVAPNGTLTERGSIPGVARVAMAHNQISGGNQLLVVNGQGGGGYVWNTSAQTFERITDSGFPGAVSVDYVSSYLVQVEPFGRFWFHSDLASAVDYNELDRYESEASPDRLVALAVSQFEVVVFNETTTEFFGNTGAATGTFQNQQVLIDVGCAGRNTVDRLDNSLFWLGNDGVVYRLAGYQAARVSTRAIEQAISGCNWAEAIAFVWEDQGHKVYYLSFPDGYTWGYDVVSGVWHRRESYGMRRWRVAHLVRWNGQWIAGDAFTGQLWVLDWDRMTEGEQPIVSRRISPVLHANQSAVVVASAELVFDVGRQGPDTDQFVEVRYSKDGGHNWNNWKRRSIGAVGRYEQRVRLSRLGRGRQWVFDIKASSPRKRDLLGAVVSVEVTDG